MTPANTANGVAPQPPTPPPNRDRLIRTAYANNNAHEANVASPAQTPVSTPIPSNCAPFDCPECNAPHTPTYAGAHQTHQPTRQSPTPPTASTASNDSHTTHARHNAHQTPYSPASHPHSTSRNPPPTWHTADFSICPSAGHRLTQHSSNVEALADTGTMNA